MALPDPLSGPAFSPTSVDADRDVCLRDELGAPLLLEDDIPGPGDLLS